MNSHPGVGQKSLKRRNERAFYCHHFATQAILQHFVFPLTLFSLNHLLGKYIDFLTVHIFMQDGDEMFDVCHFLCRYRAIYRL